ncbi:putative MFS drug efflux transporter [Phaeosphaeriaceae sp. PMI808]|nr:putative MFS drug efflux transporter [Phaeosphaeriaceae sp. PMI808]
MSPLTIENHFGTHFAEEKANKSSLPDSSIPKPPRDLNTLSWAATIVAVIRPRLLTVFGNVDKLPWVSVAYPLGAVALNLLVSNLFILFDNKKLFVVSVILFELGSTVCGAAPSMNALIVGRLICGLGGVGIFVGCMNPLSVLTSETKRPMYLNLIGLTWGAGTVLGPIVGGAFSSSPATWLWAFYMNFCVGAAMAPVYFLLLPKHNPSPGIPVRERFYCLDWIGAILCSGATASLVMGISFGGGPYDWTSGNIIALFVCSAVFWALFIFQQSLAIGTTKNHRVFPVKYLKSRHMNIFFAQTASAITVAQIPLYFIPLFFQFAKGDSALQAGVRLLPLVFFKVLGTVLSGAYLQKVGYYLPLYLLGGILSLTGGVLFFFVNQAPNTASIYGYSLEVDTSEIPKVVAFIGYGQIAGITLSLSVSSSVFLNTATRKISQILPLVSKQAVQQAVTSTGGTLFDTLQEVEKRRVLDAICNTIGDMIIATGGLTILLSMFTKWESIPKNAHNKGLSERVGDAENQSSIGDSAPQIV